MPQFRYTAVDPKGNRLTQSMTANTRADVANFLNRNHYLIIKIDAISERTFQYHRQLSHTDKIFFTQNIAVLLKSGISLGEGLNVIAADTPNKATRVFYESIRVELERGYPLSTALSHYPNVFDETYLSLIKAGESSGELATVLASLAKSLEKSARTANQVKSALIYPAIILASLVLLGLVITFFVLPKLTKIFEDIKVSLPLTTRLLISLSHLVSSHPIYVLLAIVIFLIVAGLFITSKFGRRLLLKLALHIPFISPIILNSDLLNFSSTLSLLLSAGVPIQEAMATASGTVSQDRLRAELKTAAGQLASGKAFTKLLETTSLPKTFVALISSGEQSGNMSMVLETLAQHYEDLLDTSLKNFTGIIEPILTLIVGLLVGGVVISILLPIYQFVGSLTNTS